MRFWPKNGCRDQNLFPIMDFCLIMEKIIEKTELGRLEALCPAVYLKDWVAKYVSAFRNEKKQRFGYVRRFNPF